MAATMTSKERLWAAARHEEVDKIPCSPWLRQALRILYDDYTTDSVELALRAARSNEIALDPHFNTDSDIPNVVWSITDDTRGLKDVHISLSAADDGDCELITRVFDTPAGQLSDVRKRPKPGRLEYGLGPDPAFMEHVVKGPEDLDALRCLTPDPTQCDVGAAYHRMEKRVGQFGMVKVRVNSPLDHQAGAARGVEDLMVDYYLQREFFDELMRICFDRTMAETKMLLERGVTVIMGSWYWASMSAGWGPVIYREVFLPMLKAHVELVHSYDAIYSYYDDGKCMGIIDMIKEAKADIFETLGPPPVGDVDLAEAKRRIGDEVCLMGYGDMLYVIKMGTPEEVENMVKYAMETAGPTGFIFGTCDSIREGTPRENIRTYFEAARKYGRIFAKG